MEKNEIVLFETKDKSIILPVTVENETVLFFRKKKLKKLATRKKCVL